MSDMCFSESSGVSAEMPSASELSLFDLRLLSSYIQPPTKERPEVGFTA
jgi:hypothetical protein